MSLHNQNLKIQYPFGKRWRRNYFESYNEKKTARRALSTGAGELYVHLTVRASLKEFLKGFVFTEGFI